MRRFTHPVLDKVRWFLILAVWGGVGIWLWSIAWWWAAIWVVPGFVLTMNLVGFTLLPLYWRVNARTAERDVINELVNAREGESGGVGRPLVTRRMTHAASDD